MILTKEEFELCTVWEPTLQRAQRGNMYTLGRQGVKQLMAIYSRVTGKPSPRADHCGSCELRVQKAVGGWYFKDKAEKEAIEAERKARRAAKRKAAQEAKKAAENANK